MGRNERGNSERKGTVYNNKMERGEEREGRLHATKRGKSELKTGVQEEWYTV